MKSIAYADDIASVAKTVKNLNTITNTPIEESEEIC